MAGPKKQWEDEEESTSSGSESDSPAVQTVRRGKFDDEEADDSDVLDSWDAAEDSEVEREKAKKAAELKIKTEAEAAAAKKSKAERIAERQRQRALLDAEGDESSEDETAADKRERLRRTEQEADLAHAEDLFSGIGISNSRKAVTAANAVLLNPNDPNSAIDLAALPLFKPNTKAQFELLRNTLLPILVESSKKAHYTLFLQEFTKQLAKDLPSDQIKKIASTLTALSNEKMKEEKAAEKGGKKSKAAKTKTTLAGVGRSTGADMGTYDDTFGE
ncbi:eukaryotic translation initiation factor 3 subunit J [Lasiosphaeris hirsuta]|uniref:Eukaryotic translation initiation factor 3 subunit J n=1 Tax=Lasiosphaeris hirsuta TaxID=260670 RepID=A0AA40DXQ7_9PEZI|nr:eukaryotic translation initiation factor 3 subunit J [Lasiosphaeris hirsuta]